MHIEQKQRSREKKRQITMLRSSTEQEIKHTTSIERCVLEEMLQMREKVLTQIGCSLFQPYFFTDPAAMHLNGTTRKT